MSATTAYASAPTLTIGGSVDALASDNLLSLAVEEDTVGLCWCEATFRNWGTRRGAPDYLYLSRDVIDFGTALSVAFGPDPDQREVFAGTVSALQAEYPASDVAQPHARFQKLRVCQRIALPVERRRDRDFLQLVGQALDQRVRLPGCCGLLTLRPLI